ncbi:hypothetical protein [Saccharopolyspora hattusasensis]|uniref:hypothetical protein n=1 Tax=Saccharopolyspora hattusasensis TaxID=1128679 RepID=UPI003D9547AB
MHVVEVAGVWQRGMRSGLIYTVRLYSHSATKFPWFLKVRGRFHVQARTNGFGPKLVEKGMGGESMLAVAAG